MGRCVDFGAFDDRFSSFMFWGLRGGPVLLFCYLCGHRVDLYSTSLWGVDACAVGRRRHSYQLSGGYIGSGSYVGDHLVQEDV